MTPSTDATSVLSRLGTYQNLVTLVAVVVAVPAGLYAGMATGEFAVGFLLMMVVGVDVPSFYERRWPVTYDSAWVAVAWTVVASALAIFVFLALFWVASVALGPGLVSAAGAFVVTWGAGVLVGNVLSDRY